MLVKLLDLLVHNASRLKGALLVAMAALIIADLLIPTGYDRFVWESWGGFGALFGALACLTLIGLAKGLGFGLVYRRDDYYEEELEPYRALDESSDQRNRTDT
ncbi:hypothetical protein HOP52_07925 [Halomonas campisalis]|uniref:Uncharacterized protein n=1 Tax=Billgrantia campisalis TaxID=74661 RepID=A0ABS9P7F7_9GAMM|nr:hypothetical protein [Halomonas campisalis]MCG6657684.1 hypothetical protein [Halomonas campisalis]MDR5862544.1 hypothetical protein [Halomonas campisalis]